jgi:hypothetical protein
MINIGLIAPKNSDDEVQWLLSFINAKGEAYQRGKLTQEIKFIKRHANTKVFAVAPEPQRMWPFNYDPELINLCDFYLGYKNFRSDKFDGIYQKFHFFAGALTDIRQAFTGSINNKRDIDFCIFARHDPNIRKLIAKHLEDENSIAAGPLFNNPQNSKKEIQTRCKYEFITENEKNDYYLSEKIYQSLMCGVVPIYYGCRNVKEIIPSSLFIDLNDFMVDNFDDAVSSVIDYCKLEETYSVYSSAIKENALPFLEKFASIESCMTDLLNQYIKTFEENNFVARKNTPLSVFIKLVQAKIQAKF